jgi:DNA-binding beta-propeller fold protein YncE
MTRHGTPAQSASSAALHALRCCGLALLALLAPLTAQALACNGAAAKPVTLVDVPGQPFSAIPSADGCWVYVSLTSGTADTGPGVALYSRKHGDLALERTLPISGSPMGMALTHDGQLLIVASGANVAFVDVERLTSGAPKAVLANWNAGGRLAARSYAMVSADDHYVFVTDEFSGIVSILDLAAARASGFSQRPQLRNVTVGSHPVGLTLSSDQRYLLVASEIMSAADSERHCRGEDVAHGEQAHAEGSITVIDVPAALTNPAAAVVKTVRAGCNPVRITSSPESGRVYVTARGSNALLVFEESQLTSPMAQDRPVQVAVGNAPIGVHLLDHGRRVLVANSDRWAASSNGVQSISVLDTAKIGATPASLVGSIPVHGFPREIRSTDDGNTLLVTNFSARALEVVDLNRGPWSLARPHRPRAS